MAFCETDAGSCRASSRELGSQTSTENREGLKWFSARVSFQDCWKLLLGWQAVQSPAGAARRVNRHWRFQTKLKHGFRRDVDLLSVRHGLHSGSRTRADRSADERTFAPAGEPANEGTSTCAAAHQLCGPLASPSAFLGIFVCVNRIGLAAHLESCEH